ncbi:MAG: bifunctional glycosyltransferase family 2/GtrA family protein [Lachnospiraceae bacterium]|nr:bifunctional glycosyltransferase family 2/GtrA family protein [Lachnospiraceae bacterium]
MKKIVLIPAYQPGNELLPFIKELWEKEFRIILVDDGSGEEYREIFDNARNYATLIGYEKNHGKGYALKTGLSYIQSKIHRPYVVITADADGQHLVEDIEKVYIKASYHPASLVLGCRGFDENVPLRSKFGNTVTKGIFHLCSGKKVTDTQTGLRAFSDWNMEKMISITGDRYEYEMNVLMELAADDTDIYEVKIATVYLNDNASSHFHTIRDSFRIYKEIIKFSGSSLISFALDYLLFGVISAVTGSVIIANIFARICSGSLNYTLNKRFVFQHKEKESKSLGAYLVLAICILIVNTALLKLLTLMGVNDMVAKLMVEIGLFFVSYMIQHYFIFRKKEEEGNEKTFMGPML